MKLSPRYIQEESLPPDVREWARTALLQPLNAFMKDSSTALGSGLLFSDNFVAQLLSFEVTVPTDWVTPTLSNLWVAYGSGNASPSYRKLADGTVELRGAGASGTLNTTIFTLPAAYVPGELKNLPAMSNGALGFLSITTAGAVVPVSGSNVWFDFSCRFTANDRSPISPSCFPVYVRYLASHRPIGVVPWLIKDMAQPRSTNPPFGLDWEYVSKSDGNYVKINNMPGLIPGKKYSVSLMSFAG